MALVFLAAVRQGDLAAWLQDALPSPGGGSDQAQPLRRLAAGWREFTGDADPAHATTEGWRPWMLPFHDGVMPRPLTFRLRRRPPREPGGGADETRFLLDLDLSALGALQLDGLIRPRRFDLILRGGTRLDGTLRRELQLLFQDCLVTCGYAGQLSFQDLCPPARAPTPRMVAQA